MPDLVWIILIAVALLVGFAGGFILVKFLPVFKAKEAAKQSEKIIHDAEVKADQIRKNAQIDAKQTVNELKQQAEKEIKERKQEYASLENKLNQREQNIDRRDANLTNKENAIDEKNETLNRRLRECDKKEQVLQDKIDSIIAELEKVAQLSVQEARDEIFARVESKMSKEITAYIKNKEDEAKAQVNEKALNLLGFALSKFSQDAVTERTVSNVSIPSDEMKGRIIGREGRNIRSLEQLLGVDLIIDDTPEAVVLSSFDPVRREVAKLALEKLIVDGRIHPVRIEEMVEKAREEVEKKILQEGENAAFEMGVVGLNKELIKTLGRLYFRTSYGQNVLKHSLEVGHIAGMLAAELGANVAVAKRAGLLHDIGKAVDQTQEGTHIQLGVELAARYGEKQEILHAIEAHHDDVTANTIEAVLVKLADAISAGRPGARRDTLEIYIKRLQKIEEIVNGYEGIKQSFAVQAGREVRVIVQAEQFDDLASQKLARDIAKKIEDELDYPGQIKVTVVREFRATEIAK